VALKRGDVWLEKPESVKEEVCNYFENHFLEELWERPTMDGIEFPNFSVEEADSLVQPFEELEVKDVIDSSHMNKRSRWF
jgi:hemerythrin